MPRHQNQHTDAQGWTHVNPRHHHNRTQPQPPRESPTAPSPPIYTLSTLHTQLVRAQRIWRQSRTRARLLHRLRTTHVPRVRRVICVGLGSPSARRDNVVVRQLSCVLDLRDFFAGKTGEEEEEEGEGEEEEEVDVLMQDPAFNAVDKEWFAELGCRVVPSPEAWGVVDGETALVGVHFPIANAPGGLLFDEGEGKGVWWGEVPAVVVCNDLGERSPVVRACEGWDLFGGSRATKRGGEGEGECWVEFIGTWVYVRREGM